MADKPILFSGPMIRAILDGRKTQTRRVITGRKHASLFFGGWTDDYVLDPGNEEWRQQEVRIHVGDRLWVKETVRAEELPDGMDGVRYLADDSFIPIENDPSAAVAWLKLNTIYGKEGATAPSIFMPRWASRITLTVTEVRFERLQNISEDDAKAEGAVPYHVRASGLDYYGSQHAMCGQDHRAGFCHIWESINGIESWDANPWVVAYSFDVLRGNIDSIDRRAA